MPSEQPPTRVECDCESVIGRKFLISGERQDGERVDCPRCGRDWVHICDEAEGCTWVRASKVEPAPPSEQPREGTRGELAERLEARADNPPHAEDARVETGVVCESCERPQFVGDEGWEGDGEGLDHCPRCWINAPTASELAREECLMLIDKHEDGDGMTFTTDEVEVLKRALHPHRREQPMTDTAPQEGSRVSVIAEAILADAALMHPHPDVEETTGLAYEAAERIDAALRTSTEQGAARVEGLRLTHGRHCPCSACAQQDWSEPELAPCGMHGPSCPPRYAPYHGLSVGDPAPAPDVPGSMEPDRLPFEADDYGAH